MTGNPYADVFFSALLAGFLIGWVARVLSAVYRDKGGE
jgi:uncharacterized membrane protein